MVQTTYRSCVVLLTAFLLSTGSPAQGAPSSSLHPKIPATGSTDPLPSKRCPPCPSRKHWRLILTPMAGGLNNTIRFDYDVPTGPDETTHRTKQLVDSGAGSAFVTAFIYKNLSLLNIFFIIPSVNSSMVVGDVFSVSYHQPLWRWLDLYLGTGFTYHDVRTTLRDFQDTVTKQGVSATAHFPKFKVRNDVFAPFPKVGLRFRLPIQHWHITPYVSYLYEALDLTVQTQGGFVYIPPPVEDIKTIPPINIKKWKHYHSALVGLELFFDFHYAIQLRLRAHYNTNYDKWTVRAIGSAFFHRHCPVGLSFYLEYSQGIIHDNIYGFIGPSFLY